MQIGLREIEWRGLADSQAVTRNLLVMDLPGFHARQVENVRRAALGENELCTAQYPQDQSPNDIFAFASGMQVAVEQGLVKHPGSRTYGKGQRTGCLVETMDCLGNELVVIGCR